MDGIQPRTTKIRSPWANGFVQRSDLALCDECFRATGRTTWCLEVEEIQRDLVHVIAYRSEQEHQGDQPRNPSKPGEVASSLWTQHSYKRTVSQTDIHLAADHLTTTILRVAF